MVLLDIAHGARVRKESGLLGGVVHKYTSSGR